MQDRRSNPSKEWNVSVLRGIWKIQSEQIPTKGVAERQVIIVRQRETES